MAQDGGGVPTMRATTVQPARPPTSRDSRCRRDVITLAQPRPGLARKQNEYIETPLRPQLPSSKSSKTRLKDDQGSSVNATDHSDVPSIPRSPGFPEVYRSVASAGTLLHGTAQFAVTSQPTVSSFKKEKLPDTFSSISLEGTEEQHQDSIICRQCRRCKCEACRSPRQLPSKWICNNKCLCSALSIVDHCTCMCCVKGLFYHWGKDYEMDSEVSCADQPCSCSPHKRVLRWGCLGLLSLAFPCLICYWPLQGCVKTCEMCYRRCATPGCRCTPHHRTSIPIEQAAPEKRLLDTSSDC